MSLLTKTDYYGLSSSGFEAESTSEGKTAGYTAEAQGPNGFLVAIDVGPDRQAPTVNYVATSSVSLASVVMGSVTTINNKKVALGSLTITTSAGEPVRATASGSQIEDNGTAHCTSTLTGITLSSLFHAQDFGLFTVTDGQLTNSTLSIEGNIGIAEVDGVIKASDLVGGSVKVSGTIVGVSNAGTISTPTITVGTPGSGSSVGTGVITQPLTQENPNGDFPSYSFEITWPLKADAVTP